MSVFSQDFSPPTSCVGFCNTTDEEESFNYRRHVPTNNTNEDRRLGTEDLKKKQELDNLLSEALSGLTFEEREKQQEILHGVAEVATEDPNALDRALQDLDLQLNLLKEGSIYEVAERMDPEYVSARAFRVMFLRANDYDPKASADQMLRFLEQKKDLFGPEKLVKEITIDDLNDDDIACLKSGGCQLLGKDRSGRQVILYVAGVFGESKSVQSELRVSFFVVMKALQSEETQLRGVISIWYAMGSYRSKAKGKRRLIQLISATKALPRKKTAIHICMEEMRQSFVASAPIRLMAGTLRARLRLHFGSLLECQYHLSTYGIPSELLVVNANGRLNLDRHLQWVHSCTMDAAPIAAGRPISLTLQEEGNCITTSNPKDVLFTGGKVKYSDGNQQFNSLVQDYFQAYDRGNMKSKKQVVDEVIDKIHQSGGRFLRRQTGGSNTSSLWEELPPNELRNKVTQSFRNHRRKRNSSKQSNANDCIDTVMEQLPADIVASRTSLLDCSFNMKPNPNDVIFTGTRNSKHVGNQRFAALVQEFSQMYDNGTDQCKREIVNTIIGKIHETGGRFLKQDDDSVTVDLINGINSWKEVSHDEIRKKTMQAFRNRRRRR